MATIKGKSLITETPVWFITGCSTGFGRELAKHVLALGYHTVVTARHPDQVKDLPTTEEDLVLALDVTDTKQIQSAVKATEDRFGRIDVLVNNAGIGYFAAVEEGEDQEVRRMFEINVFGLAHTIQAALPGMRRLGKGVIVNISSIGGLTSLPSLGYYNATKFAVEGLSGALRQEVEPLGIKVMVVEPSGFRTDWAGRSANGSKHQIGAYAKSSGAVREYIRASSGKQAGDPVRGARAIVNAVDSGNPPPHLLLGNDAYQNAMENLEELRKEFSSSETVSRGADFPKEKAGVLTAR
jgi:NAD(P)-dependent dehydrogenase (short-subunit alcohol dehydrogenase family)